jgi:hypothetical protein
VNLPPDAHDALWTATERMRRARPVAAGASHGDMVILF